MPTERLEPWLRGTLTELDPLRRGVLHALELAAEDVVRWCEDLSQEEMEAKLYGAASVGFHLRHIARSLDRLLTYAEGFALTESQLGQLRSESTPGADMVVGDRTLLEFAESIEVARQRVRAFDPSQYADARGVGRKMLPTTVGGLLVHCAEHTQRHAGQIVTTAKVVLGLRLLR